MGFIGFIFKKTFLTILGLVIFFALLGILNLLKFIIKNEIFLGVVNFLNANIVLILIIIVIFFIADIFWAMMFPFKLPAPIISAVASIFVVTFLYRLFILIGGFIGLNVENIPYVLVLIFYHLVFWITLLSGYAYIFSKRPKKPKKVEKRLKRIEKKLDEMKVEKEQKVKKQEKKEKEIKKEKEKRKEKPVKKIEEKKKAEKKKSKDKISKVKKLKSKKK